jgi:hypothetical protein
MTLHTILYYAISGAVLASFTLRLRTLALRLAPVLLLSACAQSQMVPSSTRSADWYSPSNVATAPSAAAVSPKQEYINYMAW